MLLRLSCPAVKPISDPAMAAVHTGEGWAETPRGT